MSTSSSSSCGFDLARLVKEQEQGEEGSDRKRGGRGVEEEDLESGSIEYRKARKRRQNRESAARSRARKGKVFQHLSAEVSTLRSDNATLRLEVDRLNAVTELMERELTQYRMMFAASKEVGSFYTIP